MEDTKHLPPGIRDPARRALTNSGIKDRVTIEKYGAETNGEYSLIRCWTFPGGGTPLRESIFTQVSSYFLPCRFLAPTMFLNLLPYPIVLTKILGDKINIEAIAKSSVQPLGHLVSFSATQL